MDILICQTPRTHSEYLPLMKLLLDKKVKFTLRKDVKLLKIYGELRGVLCL